MNSAVLTIYYNLDLQHLRNSNNDFIETHADSIIDSLRHAALVADQKRYFENEKYDWVHFIQNFDDEIDIFSKRLEYARSDTIYFSRPLPAESNFYCHPDMFSILGNTYKLRELFPERSDNLNMMDFFTKCNIRAETL
jgi:hypothetical protein